MSHTNYSVIHSLLRVILLLLLASAMVQAADINYPEAPPKLKDAEAKGLHRLSMDELKTFFPGVIELKRHRGSLATKTFKPDGSLEVSGDENFSGTWRFDEKNNAYCDRIMRKKGQDERCYAAYAAGDGVHHFEYDISDNLHTVTWRRTANK